MVSRNYVVLPKCPVCLRRYCDEVKPMVLQPCCHGMCETCVRTYRNLKDTEGAEMVCPRCREVVIEEKPNYDLLDTVPKGLTNDWTQKLIENCEEIGLSIEVNDRIQCMSELLVLRIINNDRIQRFEEKRRSDWTGGDVQLVKQMKQAFIDAVIALNMEFKEVTKWIQVLSLPSNFESYFTTQMINIYENKKFLEEMNAEWLLDIIPTSV